MILKRNHILALVLGLGVLFSGCTTIMPSTDTAQMASSAPSGMATETPPPSFVDLEENVYQNADNHAESAESDDSATPTTATDNDAPASDDASPKTAQAKLDDALELCRDSQEYWQRGELEKAVDALDQAYLLILEVEPQDDFKLIQEKEDLRFMISKIRVPADEEQGVETYSVLWGARGAVTAWLVFMATSGVLAMMAAKLIGALLPMAIVTSLLLILAVAISTAYLRHPRAAGSGRFNTLSGLWTLGLFLALGISALL